MRYILTFIVTFLIVACSGYKPAPEYANDIFEEPVLTKVKIDPEDPDAGVYLQDELSRMAINRLNLTLTKNVNEAKNYILVNRYTINTTPTNTDENGSVIRYSVNAAVEFAVKDKYGFWSKNIVASEYVSVKAQSLASALDKEKASRLAIQKALDEFVLSVMQRSRKVGKNKGELPKSDSKTDTQKDNENNQNSSFMPIDYNTTEEMIAPSAQQIENNENTAYVDNQTDNAIDSQSSDFDVKVIPVDSEDELVKDATNYN